MNSLTVKAYARGATTSISISGFDYNKISGLQFESYWPNGLFGTASFYIPGNLARSWITGGAYRVVIYNHITPVYEGYVDNIDRVADQSTSGILVSCVGAWGNILAAQGINKPWWDSRTDANTWVYKDTGYEEDFEQKLIEGKIHISPYKQSGFGSGDYAAMEYTAPIGQTVKRIIYSYDFAEASGAWEISMWRSTDGVSFTQMQDFATSGDVYVGSAPDDTTVQTSAGTGTIDVTLATASRWLQFRFYSRGANNPTGVAHIHGMMYDVGVRTETDATVTAAVVIADVQAACTDLNTSTTYVSAPSTDVAPFLTDGYETYSSIIDRVLNFGGTSGANYYAQLLESDYIIQSANGKPLLQVGAYPAVTSAYEYEVALTDRNLVAPFTLSEDYSKICNYVIVEYTDSVTGKRAVVTPDDSATLTDTTSTGLYGRRIPPGGSIDAGNTTSANAILFGARHLVKYKNPTWRLSAPIQVQGYIRKAGEIRKPCSEIRAGERVLFSNFPASPVSDPLLGAAPLISIITQASYQDTDGGIMSLSFGDLQELW